MKKSKIISIALMFIIILLLISTISFADKYTPGKFGKKISVSDGETGELKDVGGRIVGIIQVIGTIVSVGMLMILGIKYMLGSADQKAEYRKSMTPYIIGSVLIFGATNLTQIIYEWAVKI